MKSLLLPFLSCWLFFSSCGSPDIADKSCSGVIDEISDAFYDNKIAYQAYKDNENDQTKCKAYSQTNTMAIKVLENALGPKRSCLAENEIKVYEGNLKLLSTNQEKLECN